MSSGRTFHVATCPGCKEQALCTPGIDMGDMRAELERDNWHYAGHAWRCHKCHGQWRMKEMGKHTVRGERPQETGAA